MTKEDSQSEGGWQVIWQHPTAGDRFAGEVWDDRPSAEYIAAMLRNSGCRDVRIRRAAVHA